MKFIGIKKVLEGHFITRYDVTYQTQTGSEKVYEIISRDRDLHTQAQLYGHDTDAVILFLTDETGRRLLLLREYRMPTGEFVYNMPAGLLDPGETLTQAAHRELFEETGLELVRIDTVLPAAYSAVGFSNEKNTLVLGSARGDIRPSDSPEEEIQAAWFTKQQVRQLIQTHHFESRTQLYAWLWANKQG